ncbi:MAG: peptidoglycan-associated lipoprotein Pal [Sterolibacterium sp.]
MKSIPLLLIATALGVACSSTPPSPTVAATGPADTHASAVAPMPAPQQKATAAALDDPKSLLAKRSVYFPFDVFTVDPKYNEIIQAHAAYLGGHATTRMTIQGNADERGSREYNLALGQKRAEAVKRLLTMSGATDKQLEAISYGAERPKADCHEERCWQENRRDDLVYAQPKK